MFNRLLKATRWYKVVRRRLKQLQICKVNSDFEVGVDGPLMDAQHIMIIYCDALSVLNINLSTFFMEILIFYLIFIPRYPDHFY